MAPLTQALARKCTCMRRYTLNTHLPCLCLSVSLSLSLQLRNYEAELEIFRLKPSSNSKQFRELVSFLSHVAQCYPAVRPSLLL